MVIKSPQGAEGAARLRTYWLGKGLPRWATKPHPWTALRDALTLEMTKSGEDPARVAAMVNGEATNIFKEHFGYGPGARKGKNPTGPG